MADLCPVYRPRKPHLSSFYQCVQEDHYESLEMLWPERFEKRYGSLRPYLRDVMVRYLACGDFHEGFALFLVLSLRMRLQDTGQFSF